MPLTDRELDELRLSAQNYMQETREEWVKFKQQGREYLNPIELSMEEIEERIRSYGNQGSLQDRIQSANSTPGEYEITTEP